MVSSLLSNAHALKQVIQKYVVDRKSMNGELSKLWLFIKTFAQAIIRYSFELLSDKCQMDLLYIGFQAALVLHNTAKSKYSHYHVQIALDHAYIHLLLALKLGNIFIFFKPWSQSLVLFCGSWAWCSQKLHSSSGWANTALWWRNKMMEGQMRQRVIKIPHCGLKLTAKNIFFSFCCSPFPLFF